MSHFKAEIHQIRISDVCPFVLFLSPVVIYCECTQQSVCLLYSLLKTNSGPRKGEAAAPPSSLNLLLLIAQIPLDSSRHVSTRQDTTRSPCRAHAFWLCRACRTERLDKLVLTRSTRRTCRVETWRVKWNLDLSHDRTPIIILLCAVLRLYIVDALLSLCADVEVYHIGCCLVTRHSSIGKQNTLHQLYALRLMRVAKHMCCWPITNTGELR